MCHQRTLVCFQETVITTIFIIEKYNLLRIHTKTQYVRDRSSTVRNERRKLRNLSLIISSAWPFKHYQMSVKNIKIPTAPSPTRRTRKSFVSETLMHGPLSHSYYTNPEILHLLLESYSNRNSYNGRSHSGSLTHTRDKGQLSRSVCSIKLSGAGGDALIRRWAGNCSPKWVMPTCD